MLRQGMMSAPTQVQKYRRFRLLTRVTQGDGQTTFWRTENISEGGMFICAAPPLPPGTQLEVGFQLPTQSFEMSVLVEVVWTNDPNATSFRAHVPIGMGVRFVSLHPSDRNLIHDYVAQGLSSLSGDGGSQ